MTLNDWLTLLAMLLGPIVAIQVQVLLDEKRQSKARRHWVFKTLMVTRGSVLSPAHVDALNSIDIDFHSDSASDKEVRAAWRSYLDHLGQRPEKPTEAEETHWQARVNDLLAALLVKMARAVGQEFDEVAVKRAGYVPSHYIKVENQTNAIRLATLEVLAGTRPLPIRIEIPRADSRTESEKPTEKPSEEVLRELLIEHYRDGKPIMVQLVAPEQVTVPR